jgi:hypothetical protein
MEGGGFGSPCPVLPCSLSAPITSFCSRGRNAAAVPHDRRLDGFIARIITPGKHYCISGKVNSADKLYLVIESIKPDHKYGFASIAPVHPGSVGCRPMR